MSSVRKLISQHKKMAILSGAGISVDAPCGFPHAAELMQAVVNGIVLPEWKELVLSRLEVNERGKGLRFETLLYLLRKTCGLDELALKPISKEYSPNHNHRIVAELISKGWPHMTCNFDMMIERAMGARRISTLVHTRDFKAWNGEPALAKLHGSFEDRNGKDSRSTIRATLDSVGRGVGGFRFEPFRRRYLQAVLSSFPLMVIGYSGSDDFDIVPLLRSMVANCDLIWVHHKNCTPKVHENIEKAPIPNKLSNLLTSISHHSRRNSNVNLVVGSTKEVLVEIATLQGLSNEFLCGVQQFESPKCLNIEKLFPIQKRKEMKAITPGILLAVGCVKEAIEVDIMTVKEGGVGSGIHWSSFRLAMNEANQGNYKQSTECLKGLLTRIPRPEKELKGLVHFALGNNQFDQGKWGNALRRYGLSIPYFRSASCKDLEAASVFQTGKIHHGRGNLNSALELCRRATSILEKGGNLADMSVGYAFLGSIHAQCGRIALSGKYFQKSMAIKEALEGSDRGIASSLLQKAITSTYPNSTISISEADKTLAQCRGIYSSTGDKLGLAMVECACARILEKRAKLTEARSAYARARVLARDVHSIKGEAVALQGLARLAIGIGAKARYHQQAVLKFKRLGCLQAVIPKTPSSFSSELEVFI